MGDLQQILGHGIRQIQIQHEQAVWCTHCNCFINPVEPEHLSFCPYRALELAQAELARLRKVVGEARDVVAAWENPVIGRTEERRREDILLNSVNSLTALEQSEDSDE